ncbi:MAG: hypothetical protein AAFZ65_20160, partial [Planctomycetota bacterium]
RRDPRMRFKLDLDTPWTEALRESLRTIGGIDVIDAKRRLESERERRPLLDLADCLAVAGDFPGAVVEDLERAFEPAVLERGLRVGVDALALPKTLGRELDRLGERASVNLKPGRLGSWAALLDAVRRSEGRGAEVRFGGEFELGPGLRQLQLLAALLAPRAPNDVAPAALHTDSNAAFSPSPSTVLGPF